jgi:ribulose-5-phosphate 4-epimerase/fuculose-1-phosphate aldolase
LDGILVVTGSRLLLKDNIAKDDLTIVAGKSDRRKRVYFHGNNNKKCSSESHIHLMTMQHFRSLGKPYTACVHYHEISDDVLKIAKKRNVPFTSKKNDEGSYSGMESLHQLYREYPHERLFGMKGHGMICVGENLESAANYALERHKEFLKYLK